MIALLGVTAVWALAAGQTHDLGPPTGERLFVDEFEREVVDGLNEPGRGDWNARGSWLVSEGRAVLQQPQGGLFGVATVATGRPVAAIEAEIGDLRPGWGLAFRVQDPANFWYLRVIKGEIGIAVGRLEDGELVNEGSTGVVDLRSGTRVRVDLTPETIEIRVNDVLARVVFDDALAAGPRAGLIGTGPDVSGASWESVQLWAAP